MLSIRNALGENKIRSRLDTSFLSYIEKVKLARLRMLSNNVRKDIITIMKQLHCIEISIKK